MLLICSPVIDLLYVQTASRLMMVMMSITGKTCNLQTGRHSAGSPRLPTRVSSVKVMMLTLVGVWNFVAWKFR